MPNSPRASAPSPSSGSCTARVASALLRRPNFMNKRRPLLYYFVGVVEAGYPTGGIYSWIYNYIYKGAATPTVSSPQSDKRHSVVILIYVFANIAAGESNLRGLRTGRGGWGRGPGSWRNDRDAPVSACVRKPGAAGLAMRRALRAAPRRSSGLHRRPSAGFYRDAFRFSRPGEVRLQRKTLTGRRG